MKFYCAWDLAIGKNTETTTVGIVVGVDEYDQLFVMDMVRGRFDGFELVEQILTLEMWKPSITGSKAYRNGLGPFLEKRVRERGLYEACLKTSRRGDGIKSPCKSDPRPDATGHGFHAET